MIRSDTHGTGMGQRPVDSDAPYEAYLNRSDKHAALTIR